MLDSHARAWSVPNLACDLRSSTEHATAYLNGRPFLTVHRARGDSFQTLPWEAYRLDGVRVSGAWTLEAMAKRVEGLALLEPAAPPACTVQLAPDYSARSAPLALVIVKERSATRAATRWTLAGYEPGHLYMRLSWNGAPAPAFRRQSDLVEWCGLVGLTALTAIPGKLGSERFGDLSKASPVACVGGAS